MGTPSVLLYERKYGVHDDYGHAEELLPLSYPKAERKGQGHQEDKQAKEGFAPFHLRSCQVDQVWAQLHPQDVHRAPVL